MWVRIHEDWTWVAPASHVVAGSSVRHSKRQEITNTVLELECITRSGRRHLLGCLAPNSVQTDIDIDKRGLQRLNGNSNNAYCSKGHCFLLATWRSSNNCGLVGLRCRLKTHTPELRLPGSCANPAQQLPQ